jgi:hypothetical protein
MTQDNSILPEDSIYDILYYARAGETEDLLEVLGKMKAQLGISEEDVVLAAIDDQSGNSALHMSAANGHTGRTILMRRVHF